MFYMISNPHEHKNNAFKCRCELFPIWELAAQLYYTVNSYRQTVYTVTPSINTDLKGGSDMVNVLCSLVDDTTAPRTQTDVEISRSCLDLALQWDF